MDKRQPNEACPGRKARVTYIPGIARSVNGHQLWGERLGVSKAHEKYNTATVCQRLIRTTTSCSSASVHELVADMTHLPAHHGMRAINFISIVLGLAANKTHRVPDEPHEVGQLGQSDHFPHSHSLNQRPRKVEERNLR